MSVTATDLFCGAGGSSLGAEIAGVELRIGLNHWDRAVETHAANFQDADHVCDDVQRLSTTEIRRLPATDMLIASPECTGHSLAKGAMRRKPQAASLWEDGPASDAEQDRSRATMWDVVRFADLKQAQGHPYKTIVCENVTDAFKWGPGDNGAMFDAWLNAMDALGYRHEIVWLNSMFAGPVPQSRNRMYVVFWLDSMRSPHLNVEPISWCSNCGKLVHGLQSWKKLGGRLWGSYGSQYLYACPDCRKTVHPGAFPAAAAIDWTLKGTVIGERKHPLAVTTIERIRRGLTRLGQTPFAVRLTHAGSPTPMTLPLFTVTARQDVAMVFPVGGTTWENTPGNRAKASDRDPLQTINGSLERAMVVPPMGGVDPRDAFTAPAPTQTTTTRAAVVEMQNHGGVKEVHEPTHCVRAGGFHHGVVMANRIHGEGTMRPAGEGPAQCVTTAHGGGLAMLMSAYGAANGPPHKAGWARAAALEQFGGITAKDSHSLVVPYQSEPHGPEEPCRTVTTHDRLAMVVPDGEEPPPMPDRDWTDKDIDECTFRMFELHEIAEAMAMARHSDGESEYVTLGNKRERMRLYGNAVTPPAMELIVGRLLEVM